ncbi:hypothetical protein [Streptomyces sp. TR02-1]|uniref:hypothetical protein n=1 Tax=Streptomyces sp. TR02-1 TaxID=3385977 RepID=UPI00399F4220
MEHEVYVPFPVGPVREVLADRERVASCVPGLRLDAVGDGLDGRLRVRLGGSTITYRGSATLVPQGDGFLIEGSGTEARGTGSVTLSLKLVPRVAADGEGTRLTCSATITGTGRIADHEEKTAAGAGRRLLDRFCVSLAESLREDASAPEPSDDPADGTEPSGRGPGTAGREARQAAGLGEPDDNDRAIPGIPNPEKGERDAARPSEDECGAEAEPAADAEPTVPAADDAGEPAPEPSPEEASGGLFGTDVPPSSLDPFTGEDEPAEEDAATAEAAHARRTMIGRSAEEVDHAPPRGRYAPVPPPQTPSAPAALRWAGPAAAAALAGAVVLTRVLRRRR